MAELDRKELNRWQVTDVDDLISALEDARSGVHATSVDSYLSWAIMNTTNLAGHFANVGEVVLYSVEMGDGSFCYEVELIP